MCTISKLPVIGQNDNKSGIESYELKVYILQMITQIKRTLILSIVLNDIRVPLTCFIICKTSYLEFLSFYP
jgi:hypothetical protein